MNNTRTVRRDWPAVHGQINQLLENRIVFCIKLYLIRIPIEYYNVERE